MTAPLLAEGRWLTYSYASVKTLFGCQFGLSRLRSSVMLAKRCFASIFMRPCAPSKPAKQHIVRQQLHSHKRSVRSALQPAQQMAASSPRMLQWQAWSARLGIRLSCNRQTPAQRNQLPVTPNKSYALTLCVVSSALVLVVLPSTARKATNPCAKARAGKAQTHPPPSSPGLRLPRADPQAFARALTSWSRTLLEQYERCNCELCLPVG